MRPRDRWLSLAAGLLAVAAALAVTAAVARWFHLATWRFDPVSVATWRGVVGGLADGIMAIRTWWAWSWAASFPLLAMAACVVGVLAWRRRHHLAAALQALADSGPPWRGERRTSTSGKPDGPPPSSQAAAPAAFRMGAQGLAVERCRGADRWARRRSGRGRDAGNPRCPARRLQHGRPPPAVTTAACRGALMHRPTRSAAVFRRTLRYGPLRTEAAPQEVAEGSGRRA